jgi:hypothetical protein
MYELPGRGRYLPVGPHCLPTAQTTKHWYAPIPEPRLPRVKWLAPVLGAAQAGMKRAHGRGCRCGEQEQEPGSERLRYLDTAPRFLAVRGEHPVRNVQGNAPGHHTRRHTGHHHHHPARSGL